MVDSVHLSLSPGFRDLLDVTFLNRFQDGAGAIADTQLPEDVGYIIFDGSFRESQRGSDLTITVSSGHQTENLSFARRQLFFVIRRRRKRRSRQSAPETFRDHRTDHRSATSYQPDRFSQLRQRNVFYQVAFGAQPDATKQCYIVIESRQQ